MINGLQLYRSRWHAGLTESSHLSNAFLTEPDIVSTLVSRVFGWSGATAMDYLTKGLGRTKEIQNREYQWYLQGDDEKAIACTGNFGDGGATPGINRTTFRVKFAEKWFSNSDVLRADVAGYECRVMEDPYQSGSDFVYTLKLVNPDPTRFITSALISSGAQFSKDYSTQEEFSSTSGDTHFATPFALRNHLTTLRKSYSISRSAMTDVLVIQATDAQTGKKTNMWVMYAEWQALAQWMREVEMSLWYSMYSANAQGTTDVLGATGRPVYQGAGIREQISASNKRYYTTLTENIVREFLIDLSYNTRPDGERKFVAFTGEFGFSEFDKAMKNSASQFTLVDTKFVQGSGQELLLGGQFVTYRGLNGTELTLKKLPLYDNTVRHRELHPASKRPKESYRMTILDFSMYDGESNVQKVYKKDSELVQWYIEGSCGPMGTKRNSSASSPIDGYVVHYLTECGIMIKNPLSCGELILN